MEQEFKALYAEFDKYLLELKDSQVYHDYLLAKAILAD